MNSCRGFFNHRPRALDQFLRLHRGLRQRLDRPHILLHRAADLLIIIGVNQRADAFIENTSASSPSSTRPLMMWTRGTPGLARGNGVERLETCSGAMSVFCSAMTDSRSTTGICRMTRP